MATKQELENKLWAIANELRGNMDANEFKNYMLGFIFYQHLSEKIERFATKELEVDEITFLEACKDEEMKEALKEECILELGFFLEPEYLFHNIVAEAKEGKFILQKLQQGLINIEKSALGHDSEKEFVHIFDDLDLTSTKLGKTEDTKNQIISSIIKHLSEIDFHVDDTERDILGDAYEYLIAQFASSAGKKAGEFYTPQQVSKILSKIVTIGKTRIKSVYDPTCGSGSLLLRVTKETKVSHLYGQELNQTTYNLAIMNMILHDVKHGDFSIEQGDTLEDPQHIGEKFEAIVANPPFSANWSANATFMDDERFSQYGKLAPRTKADFAFVQHMLHHLDENGTMAIVLPHGVLFRGAAEGVIREYLIKENNYLDAVIGLPANIFYGTSIPTVILVFKKCREHSDNILFIDASNEFEKIKTQNILRETDIEKIIKTYSERKDIEKYAHVATMKEIAENDYNLNIPRYVDTFEEEEIIDLTEIVRELKNLEAEIKATDEEIKKYCDRLGTEAPIF